MFPPLAKKCFHFRKTIQKGMTAFAPAHLSSSTTLKAFFTPEKLPANHTKNELGLFYLLPNSLSLDTLFKGKVLKTDYIELCKTFQETPFLIRKPAMEIIHCLKNTNFNDPVNKYLLYGKWGNGKTLTMCHVIHYAYTENWLIIHVPKILDWFDNTKETVESSTSENCMDLPIVASSWLIHFKNQNEELIKKLDLIVQNDYKWNIQEETKKGESLISLINHGIMRAKYACNVVNALLAEIKSLSKSGKVKTLVAIDGYNWLFLPQTRIKNRDREYVPPEQISCIKTFKELAQSDWNNGAVILTCDSLKNMDSPDDYLPMKMLRTEGFEYLVPFIPVEVAPLTDKEIVSILSYYRSKKWLQESEGDQELIYLSAGNFLTLNQLCGPL